MVNSIIKTQIHHHSDNINARRSWNSVLIYALALHNVLLTHPR